MVSRCVSFVVWLTVVGSALLWGQGLFAGPGDFQTAAASSSPVADSKGDLTRLLGADLAPQSVEPAPNPAPASRLRLVGVIAAPQAVDRSAVALIEVEEKPARAFRPGDVVEAGVVLLEVHPRGASVGPRGGPAASELALAEPPAAVSNPVASGAIRPSQNAAVIRHRPPTIQPEANANGGFNAAPNVLMNNPADMAPAKGSGAAQASQR